MIRPKISRPPSPYPRTIFHTIRAGQVMSSIIVMSVLAYFVYWLSADNYYVPWTFLLLLSVSSCTNISIIITTYFYHERDLKPRLSLYINSFLTFLWCLGFALLTWNISGLLNAQCTITQWEHETGVMICRLYKALESFTITGMLFTASALALDIHTQRNITRLGTYDQMGAGDLKRSLQGHGIIAAGSADNHATSSTDLGDASHGYREPSLEFPEYSHEVKRPYRVQRPIEAQDFGYAAPSEQTRYDGASARVLDRDFEEIRS